MGNPKPPLRIIAPNGAPIKNIKKQEKVITNLSYSAIQCRLMFFCFSSISNRELSKENIVPSILLLAILII